MEDVTKVIPEVTPMSMGNLDQQGVGVFSIPRPLHDGTHLKNETPSSTEEYKTWVIPEEPVQSKIKDDDSADGTRLRSEVPAAQEPEEHREAVGSVAKETATLPKKEGQPYPKVKATQSENERELVEASLIDKNKAEADKLKEETLATRWRRWTNLFYGVVATLIVLGAVLQFMLPVLSMKAEKASLSNDSTALQAQIQKRQFEESLRSIEAKIENTTRLIQQSELGYQALLTQMKSMSAEYDRLMQSVMQETLIEELKVKKHALQLDIDHIKTRLKLLNSEKVSLGLLNQLKDDVPVLVSLRVTVRYVAEDKDKAMLLRDTLSLRGMDIRMLLTEVSDIDPLYLGNLVYTNADEENTAKTLLATLKIFDPEAELILEPLPGYEVNHFTYNMASIQQMKL